jgi:hypothetical protein
VDGDVVVVVWRHSDELVDHVADFGGEGVQAALGLFDCPDAVGFRGCDCGGAGAAGIGCHGGGSGYFARRGCIAVVLREYWWFDRGDIEG